MIELILAVIGAVAVVLAILAVIAGCTWAVVYRIHYGVWWWDEASEPPRTARPESSDSGT